MEVEIIKSVASQGAFAVLFIWLFIDTRKDSKEREKELRDTIGKNQEIIKENQTIIGSLTENFTVLETVKKDVIDIKDKIFE